MGLPDSRRDAGPGPRRCLAARSRAPGSRQARLARADRLAHGRILPAARLRFPVCRDGLYPEVHFVPEPSVVLGRSRTRRFPGLCRPWQWSIDHDRPPRPRRRILACHGGRHGHRIHRRGLHFPAALSFRRPDRASRCNENRCLHPADRPARLHDGYAVSARTSDG